MGSQWNTQTGTTLWTSDVTQKPVQLTDFQKHPNSWISVVSFCILLKFMEFLRQCWLPMIILLTRVAGNHQRSTRMCWSISCSKMFDSFTSCQTTFLSLRSFIGQSLLMLLPFPGGLTSVCFSNSLRLLWRHNYHVETSFVAQEIRKHMFDLLSATNRKWLVWQEVACLGLSVKFANDARLYYIMRSLFELWPVRNDSIQIRKFPLEYPSRLFKPFVPSSVEVSTGSWCHFEGQKVLNILIGDVLSFG